AAAIQLAKPALEDRIPYRVVAHLRGDEADPQGPACLPPRRRNGGRALPAIHEMRAQRAIAREERAVVLFLVGELEGLVGADGGRAERHAALVEPSFEAAELGGERAAARERILALCIDRRQLRHGERPARLGVV